MHAIAQIPAVGEIWPSGHHVRRGTIADVAAIARWRADDTTLCWSLRDAIRTLGGHRDGAGLVVYAVAIASQLVGVIAITAPSPFLQLVYLDHAQRGAQLGTRATSVVVEHFFTHHTAVPWLGVTQPISPAGVRLFARLGFVELHAGMQLTRETWGHVRAPMAERF